MALQLLALGLLSSAAWAKTVTYDFNITWVNANPDDAFERRTIGINGQFPLPPIVADIKDRVIVNVQNQLGNQTTSLHFHGLYQNGTTEMDGAVGVSQCGIPPGESFTYDFNIDQPGTYWYHSHQRGQYPDGLRAPLIVHDPDSPYKGKYDEEIVLTLSDWYHDQMPDLLSTFISVANPTGAEPVPDAALMNDTQNLKINVQPDKTYFFRIINVGAFAAQHFWFEDHDMQIVEVDGVYTDPATASMIYITPAQRYSVLLKTKKDIANNFAIVGSMDEDLFDTVPDTLNPNVTGWLVYDQKKDMPEPALLDAWDDFDDFTLVPQDHQEIYDHVDHTVSLDVKMDNLGDGANYAFFNDISYVTPKVPTLYSALTTGPDAMNPAVYGVNTNAFVLKKDEVVEIVLNSDDPGKHPFHLHGHAFQAVARGDEEAGHYNGSSLADMPRSPMRRDTFTVWPDSYIVLRFKADNPDNGLVATIVEAPLDMQKTIKVPQDHYDVCKAGGVPTAGNAAGNTKDFMDLTGENVPPAPLPDGFTARGIVALVFSIIAAFIGMAVISWYGMGDIPKKAQPIGTVN